MKCPNCSGEKVDWVQLKCSECGAREENGWAPAQFRVVKPGVFGEGVIVRASLPDWKK